MSAWDYIMPHRLIINKLLRKVAQDFRGKVDKYQIEFDRRLEECKIDLERAEENKNRELEAFKAELLQEFIDDYQTLEEIQVSIVQYIDCYFYRSYLYQLKEINQRENDIFHEEYKFLSSEMKSIDDEIAILRERQNELTAFTRVDDIIHLATLTGYDLDFQSTDDAKRLLSKISDALRKYSGEDRVEKDALIRLKTIIQERSEYLPTINYISWVIRIKRRFRKQLSSRRSSVKKEQAILREKKIFIKNEIRTLTDKLESLAEKVRYCWTKPIAFLNADICFAYLELKEEKARLLKNAPVLKSERKELKGKKQSAISDIQEMKRRRRNVGSELRSMRDSHSSDQWKWDSLKSEGSSLTSDIDSLSATIQGYSSDIDSLNTEIDYLESAVKRTEAVISSKKAARKQWAVTRTRIIVLIKQYDKSFRTNRKIAENDERNIIIARLDEIRNNHVTGVAQASREEKKLLLRLDEIDQQQGGGGLESKY